MGAGPVQNVDGGVLCLDITNRQLLCFEPLLLNVWGCCQLKFQCEPLVWDYLAVTFRELCPRDTKGFFFKFILSSTPWTTAFMGQYEGFVSVHGVF